MNPLISICLIFAVISVLAVLGMGIFSMAKGGEFNKKYGNMLMRARVLLQGIAIALLVIAYIASKN